MSTNSLPSRLERAVAFDPERDSSDGDDDSIKYLSEVRLKPLLLVLPKLAEALVRYQKEDRESGMPEDEGYADNALTELESALAAVEGEK